MWQASYQTTTDVPAKALFHAIADVKAWSECDPGLEDVKIDGPVVEGATFMLRPKGGPDVRMSIEELRECMRMADVAHLPLAKLRTVHEFAEERGRTTLRFSVQVWGPLGFLWRRVIGERQIQEAREQSARFIHYARERYA